MREVRFLQQLSQRMLVINKYHTTNLFFKKGVRTRQLGFEVQLKHSMTNYFLFQCQGYS
jgi:hypothetical protein